MTYEPQNAFDFAGYWLALSLAQAQEGMDAPSSRVSFYGGTLEDSQKFGEKVETMEFVEVTDEFFTNAPPNVVFGSWILTVPKSDEHPDLFLIHAFDYVNNDAGALIVPFTPKTTSQAFSFADPETMEIWGSLRENQTFRTVAVFSMLEGLKQHAAFPVIYQGFTGNLLKNSN